MEWAGAEWTGRKAWKIKGGVVWMDGLGWGRAEWDRVEWHGVSRETMEWTYGNGRERRNGAEWIRGKGWHGPGGNSARLDGAV